MIRIWYIQSVIILLCLFFCYSFTYGESFTVTWDEPVDANNWTEVTGFDLRVNTDIIVIEGNVRQWDGNVTLVEGTNVAVLRAVTPSEMSDWSEPCYFNRDVPFKLFAPTGCTVINIVVN